MSTRETNGGPTLARSVLVHVALAVVGLIVAIPLYWTVISSLSTNTAIFATPVQWVPPALHWAAW